MRLACLSYSQKRCHGCSAAHNFTTAGDSTQIHLHSCFFRLFCLPSAHYYPYWYRVIQSLFAVTHSLKQQQRPCNGGRGPHPNTVRQIDSQVGSDTPLFFGERKKKDTERRREISQIEICVFLRMMNTDEEDDGIFLFLCWEHIFLPRYRMSSPVLFSLAPQSIMKRENFRTSHTTREKIRITTAYALSKKLETELFVEEHHR